jgi:hypothetical protein
MEDVVLFVFSAILWALVIRLLLAGINGYLTSKIQARQEIMDKIDKIVHRVVEEHHGNIRYWYDQDSDEFLAQGNTDDEIKLQLQERFRCHIFILPEQEIAMLGPDLRVVPLSNLVKELET